ncbi:MAG: FkbM family methyltransferase [Alphaproteobacteria bacterium]
MLPRVDIIREKETTWLLINGSDLLSNTIKQRGRWGNVEHQICQAFLHKTEAAIVIDAGANLGSFTIPIAQHLMGRKGKIFSFEPQRIVFQQLCANIFINQLDNVYTHNIALGEENSIIEIPEMDFAKSGHIGAFSVDPSVRENLKKAYEEAGVLYNVELQDSTPFKVSMQTLDSFELFENVAFIKVDVEGLELEFFKGAVETLKKNNYPPIMFELWKGRDWYKEKAEKTKDFLTSLGYDDFKRLDGDIFVQHPSHGRHISFEREGNNLSFSLRVSD